MHTATHSRVRKLRIVGRMAKVLDIMKTPHSLMLLFSSWFLLNVSSLYVSDRRNPRHEESSERTDENSIGVHPQSLDLDVFKHIEGAGRENEIGKATRLPEKQQSFIKCVFKLNGTKKPEYTCDHSKDIEIKWHEEKGRLMGTFATSFHCSKQRSITEEMHNPLNKDPQKWGHLIREKRRAVYRNDAGEVEAQGEAAEQTEEEAIAPEVTDEVAAEEDPTEESQLAPPEKEVPVGEVESDGDDDEGQKGANEDDTASAEGSPEDKEIPGADGGAEEVEKQVSVVEKEEDQATDVEDKEVPAPEVSEGEKIEATTSSAEKNGNETKNDEEEDSGGLTVLIDLSAILPMEKIVNFVYDVGNIVYQAGDYVLNLLLRDMKRRLRGARINERFDAKVEKLAKNYGGDTGKALGIMEKRIQSQLGKSYELEIVKLLQELRDGLKL